MKNSFFTTLLAAGALAFGVAACDSASGLDTASNSEALQALASELGLSAADVADISASFSSVDPETGEVRDPGELWRLAAQLHSTMSDEQIERLMQRAAEARLQGPGQQGQRPGMRPGQQGQRPGMRPGQQGQRPGMRPGQGQGMRPGQQGQRPGPGLDLDLTDEQEAAIEAIHEAARAEVQALRGQNLDQEALREAIQAIREQTRADVEAVLTDEQRQTIADRQTEREAKRAEVETVRNEVLGLTAEQIAGLEALIEIEDRDERKAAMTALLTETQHEITAIHRFLSQRAGQGGPGGPGGHGPNGRPGQNG